jgi:hypothetical protein
LDKGYEDLDSELRVFHGERLYLHLVPTESAESIVFQGIFSSQGIPKDATFVILFSQEICGRDT